MENSVFLSRRCRGIWVASRPDMAVWQLRPEEATQLATPIANMIQKSEALQKMGEYSDAIALVTASLVIFAPRAMVYHDQQKQKKAEKGVIKRTPVYIGMSL